MVKDFEILPDPLPSRYNLISFLSPITVHRTFVVDEIQKTQYLTPDDPDFNSLISINAYKKAKELGLGFSENDCRVTLTEMSDPQKSKIKSLYKDFTIIGYQGTFALSGNPQVISFLLKTGIGCRNSSGFGMFELLR
jgi:CRISPR-associated endoribonuclease Cas6